MKRGRGAAVCAVRARYPPGCPTARVSGRRPAIGRQPACDSCVFYAVSAPSLGARALLRWRMTVVGADGAPWHYVFSPSPLAHVEFFCYWPIVRCRACPLVNRQLLPFALDALCAAHRGELGEKECAAESVMDGLSAAPRPFGFLSLFYSQEPRGEVLKILIVVR